MGPLSQASVQCVAASALLRSASQPIKVRRGGPEEIPLVQGKEQWLRFAGAAVKRYPTSKVRETQDSKCCQRASEGRHTETIITET